MRTWFQILSSFCLMWSLPLFSSILSNDLAERLAELVDAQFRAYQKEKNFIVNQDGIIAAIDPNGALSDDLIVHPRAGETLEVLFLDKKMGQLYYKGSSIAGKRVGQIGVFGDAPIDRVVDATRVTFSPRNSKFYWTKPDAVRSITLSGTNPTVIARVSGLNINKLKGWAWIGVYPWAYSPDSDDLFYFKGTPWVFQQTTDSWSQGFQDTGITGWTWWGDFPWVYANGLGAWSYVQGDLLTYFHKTASLDLLESTSTPFFQGTPEALHVPMFQNEVYFQLNPPVESRQNYGAIEKLNPGTNRLTTIVPMTNATHILTLPGKNRLYWAESVGLYSTTLAGGDRTLILSTPGFGVVAPTPYFEPTPMTPGANYHISLSPHAPGNPSDDLILKDSNKFTRGFGRGFISGEFKWDRGPDGENVVITLTSGNPVSAFPDGGSHPYPGRTVQEIYESSNRVKDLPTYITLTLNYRDSHHGTFTETRSLVSGKVEIFKGDFSTRNGSFTGMQLRHPPSYHGSRITKLQEGDDGNLKVIIHEASGGSRSIQVDAFNQVIDR